MITYDEWVEDERKRNPRWTQRRDRDEFSEWVMQFYVRLDGLCGLVDVLQDCILNNKDVSVETVQLSGSACAMAEMVRDEFDRAFALTMNVSPGPVLSYRALEQDREREGKVKEP